MISQKLNAVGLINRVITSAPLFLANSGSQQCEKGLGKLGWKDECGRCQVRDESRQAQSVDTGGPGSRTNENGCIMQATVPRKRPKTL
jgi:hypothetical protein